MFIVTQGSVLVMVPASPWLVRGLRLSLTWPPAQGDLAPSLSVWLELAGLCGGSLTSTASSPT